MDSRTLDHVDGFASRIEAIAAEMAAQNVASAFRTGAPAILADLAQDLRLQTRELERIPTSIRLDRISAFAPKHIQASGERADVAEPIRKLFAAAAVPLPATGSTVAPAVIDLVVQKANLDPADRMAIKSQCEAAGLVVYGYTPMRAKP